MVNVPFEGQVERVRAYNEAIIKLLDERDQLIRYMLNDHSTRDVGAALGISHHTVLRIARGDRGRWVGRNLS